MGRIKVHEVAYHGNGVGGTGFQLVEFVDESRGMPHDRKLAVVFPNSGAVAVWSLDELLGGKSVGELRVLPGDDLYGRVLQEAFLEGSGTIEVLRGKAGKNNLRFSPPLVLRYG